MKRVTNRNKAKRELAQVKRHLLEYRRENEVRINDNAMLEYRRYRDILFASLGIFNKHNDRNDVLKTMRQKPIVDRVKQDVKAVFS